MVSNTKQLEKECETEQHDEHLCYIVSQGLHLNDQQAYSALTRDPRFFCHHCGRIAKSGANLCVPVDL